MRKVYSLFVALGVAAASLTSCSKSTYSFNSAPAYLGSQPVAVAKAAPAATVATPAAEAAAPATNGVTPAPVAKATPAKAASVAATAEAAPATETATVATAPAAKAAKPNLVQRLVLNKVAKQIAKVKEQKQAAVGTDKVQSLKKTGLFVALGGLLAILIGFLVAGGSLAGGSGAGFVIGAILIYLGYVALVVGGVVAIIGLIADK